MNMRKLIAPLFVMLLVLTGCENNDLLQSEEKVNSQIKGTWKKVKASSVEQNEDWKFDNGTLTISKKINDPDSIVVDHAQYTVTTKFSKSYVTISGLSSYYVEFLDLNRQWTIAEISGNVLYLSTTNSQGAIISREFVKK